MRHNVINDKLLTINGWFAYERRLKSDRTTISGRLMLIGPHVQNGHPVSEHRLLGQIQKICIIFFKTNMNIYSENVQSISHHWNNGYHSIDKYNKQMTSVFIDLACASNYQKCHRYIPRVTVQASNMVISWHWQEFELYPLLPLRGLNLKSTGCRNLSMYTGIAESLHNGCD